MILLNSFRQRKLSKPKQNIFILRLKKSSLLFLLLLIACTIQAQEKVRTFKPFKLDLAVGAALPFDSKLHSTTIIAIEPKYALNDKVAVGLRFEFANLGPSNSAVSFVDLNFTTSTILTADYYFNTNKVRPFAGVGVGIYDVPAQDVENSDELQSDAQFGFVTRGGIETGRFRTALEVNLTGKNELASFSYIGIKAGFFLWGARINKD